MPETLLVMGHPLNSNLISELMFHGIRAARCPMENSFLFYLLAIGLLMKNAILA